MAAGKPHTVGVDLGGPVVGQRTPPASPPPPNLGPTATWLDVANAVRALPPMVGEVWWATLPEPGEIHATVWWPDVLCPVNPGLNQHLLHAVA